MRSTWVTARLASTGSIDRLRRHVADRDGAVLAIDVVDLERVAEALVGGARAREHQQAARRQIEPVHEVDLAEARRELIEQVAAIALGRRCGDEPRGLVGDDHVLVDEHDRRRGRRLGALERAADVDLDALTGAHGAPGDLDARAIDEHAAEVDDLARLAPR
jgi:hypothetical protein